MHQFGIRPFRLYRLPIPKRGYVVGLLGKNGIGKSTIINILSGNVRPNFGDYDKSSHPKKSELGSRTELRNRTLKKLDGSMRASISHKWSP